MKLIKCSQEILDASFDPGYLRQERPRPPITVAISKEEFDSKYYKIESGILLIISNTEFHVHDANLGDHAGSHIDAYCIAQRFSGLGFECELKTNLSKSDTMDWFERAKSRLFIKAVDCFVLVILSHGTDNGVYATDQLIRNEDIIEAFNATHCPPLRFKPKILITQSCRGTHLSGGINVGVFDPNQDDDSRYPSEYHEWIGIPITKTICLPNEADFLFVYAAVSGSAAFRNAAECTPFIRHLSKAIEDMEVNEDFYEVLNTVHTAMGVTYNRYGEVEYNNQAQMPCFVSYLTKLLRLKQAT
ncbi:CASP3 [Mytilus coruscus]|uniref:CASP3 n=1 Tax=Mytilus coruscus TaxID=42192 RepID=A0A6J8EAD6_MYTCO|nr:CASP3 [Mytilus coruscus]